MSTESLKVFVDNRLEKTVNFYYYQVIRRLLFNEDKKLYKENMSKILGDCKSQIINVDNLNIDMYKNIFDENNNNIGFIDWIGKVIF